MCVSVMDFCGAGRVGLHVAVLSDVWQPSCPTPLMPYSALDVFEFWEYLEAKAVSLTSGPAASVHVVSQSQHQAHHLPHTITLQQSLKTENTHISFSILIISVFLLNAL